MTIHREWGHTTTQGQDGGFAMSTGVGVSGNVALTGGGWAELVKQNNSNQNSTDTTGNTASSFAPLLASYPTYDPVGNITTLLCIFAVPPGVNARTHIMTVWEA